MRWWTFFPRIFREFRYVNRKSTCIYSKQSNVTVLFPSVVKKSCLRDKNNTDKKRYQINDVSRPRHHFVLPLYEYWDLFVSLWGVVMLHDRSAIIFSVFLISAWRTVPVQCVRDGEQVCAKDQSALVNDTNLKLCYVNNVRDRYIQVWFNIGEYLNSTFHEYRFVIFSSESELLHNERVEHESNFSILSDFNETLRIKQLETGQYKVCVDFRAESSDFIYEPRDACILIRIGEISHRSFDESAVPISVTLVGAIVIFFILGLISPSVKKRRDARRVAEERLSVGSISTNTLGRRGRVAKRLFSRHVEDGSRSRLHQWARTRVSRHMIAPDDDELIFQQYVPEIRSTLHQVFASMVPSLAAIREDPEPEPLPPRNPTPTPTTTRPPTPIEIELTSLPARRSKQRSKKPLHESYEMMEEENF